jgi:hypothetical protein
MRANVKTAREAYSAGNQTAARVILADVARYGWPPPGAIFQLAAWYRKLLYHTTGL